MGTTIPMYLRPSVLIGVGLSGGVGLSDRQVVWLSGHRNIRLEP